MCLVVQAATPSPTMPCHAVPCHAVFCAFAHWMHAQQGLEPAERQALAARVLPHIRFLRPATVATYWHGFEWFRCPIFCSQVVAARAWQPSCGSRRQHYVHALVYLLQYPALTMHTRLCWRRQHDASR